MGLSFDLKKEPKATYSTPSLIANLANLLELWHVTPIALSFKNFLANDIELSNCPI